MKLFNSNPDQGKNAFFFKGKLYNLCDLFIVVSITEAWTVVRSEEVLNLFYAFQN